eukprot:1232056-Prymnesium_polylepis.1
MSVTSEPVIPRDSPTAPAPKKNAPALPARLIVCIAAMACHGRGASGWVPDRMSRKCWPCEGNVTMAS